MNKWLLEDDPRIVRRVGKLGEELGECSAVAARIVIQGLDAIDPASGLTNRQRLMDEMADVQAQIACTTAVLNLDRKRMNARTMRKIQQMDEWENLYPEDNGVRQ